VACGVVPSHQDRPRPGPAPTSPLDGLARWTTLVIAAHAFLAAATTASTTSPAGMIAITVNELRRPFHALVIDPTKRIADVIAWSVFRRRHQDAAKTSHYERQAPYGALKQISCWSIRRVCLLARPGTTE
jgi:hypothetical protein